MSWRSPTDGFAPSKASQQVVEDNVRVMDKTWENIQKKTFTNWINNQLKQKDVAPLENLDTDLCTGEKLIQLLEIIGDESLGRYNKNPKLRIQKVENMNKALEFIRRRGVNLTNIGAEDIVDANVKLILGLIWTIILRFTISEISEEGLSAKEGLLLWCQRRTAPYASDFHIKDFTFSWQDGLALCGLIHRHRPDLLDYWALDKSRRHENTQLAFDVAEQQLGIPKLFEVEDIVDVAKPDERSVMTYVAQYFHAFSAQDKMGVAGRRVGQMGVVMQQAWEMQNEYERRVRALMDAINGIQSIWGSTGFAGYSDARRQLHEFETYKSTTKRGWVAERRELDSLLGNIQTKLKTYNLRPYSPPQGHTLQDLATCWDSLVEVEAGRKRAITVYIRDTKDALKKKFANAANQFQNNLNNISGSLTDLEGDLSNQLDTVHELILRLEPLKNDLQDLERLNAECMEAHIEDNEFTIYSVEDLSFDFGLLTQSVVKKSAFIENQMVARTKTNITPEQLEEFTETFRLCDVDNSNSLKREEFKSALQAEGTDFDDTTFENLFQTAVRGGEEVSFEQFIDFMKAQQEDRANPEQLKVSFQTLAGDKPYITEADLYRGGLAPALVEYLKQAMPARGEGYDYAQFVDGVFV
ncbi:uncharacterized protein SPPG_06332 [Spizellomyces punctatus DAOM BR117]|uniref:Uncharacterized protein n=1 Tax=Spizellomyces punctatus (strain DAOM BR117) TaxID=645134 RepID=A0A0L0HAR8_SPIPD|nr:uncharacterized protein SPPG_06332 [Spizellomyces punctatus DAOM BR117]KNC98650.1 hypothetical protein SPPG_06332 [Spizellomyces punctatus DAOM BR117]|eukprot:XP_016606690.1 hypothetical protein SPPG_06332 [Spizellomyces punctatus DAOM BR117]